MLFGEGSRRLIEEKAIRPVSPWLAFGIFICPVIFVWWLLREGHTTRARLIGFAWLLAVLCGVLNG